MINILLSKQGSSTYPILSIVEVERDENSLSQ